MSEEPVRARPPGPATTPPARPGAGAEPGPATVPSYQADPHRWRVLGVSLVIGFMALLDVTIVNVALPSIRTGLGTTPGTVQWMVSGYALAFGLTLVTGGRLGDAYGRRRMMLLGLAGFIATSAAVGVAPTVGWAILARLLQGGAAGLLTPQNSGLIQQLFRGAERARAFGFFGLTVSISSALGPVLGGVIIELAGAANGWRWIFLVNVPIGVVAMIGVRRMVPRRAPRPDRQRRERLDLVGAALLGLTVLSLLLPLVSVEGGHRLPLLLLVLVVPLLVAFVGWERRLGRRGEDPLLDVALLRRTPGYGNGLAVGSLYFTGFTGVFLVLSVFFQDELGYSPLAAGLLLTPFALGSALTAPLAGRLVSRIHRRITVISLVVMMAGVLAVALLVPGRGPDGLWMFLVPPLLVAGLGGGGVVSPNFTLSLAEVPPSMGGAAGGALQTGQRIGASIGAALLMTVYQLTLGTTHTSGRALEYALLAALAVLAVALAMALLALRDEKRRVAAGGVPG